MSDRDLLDACRNTRDLYPMLDEALDRVIGHKLFTLMAIDWPRGEAARIYTNKPDDYPIGGRKPLGALTDWGKTVLEDRQPWIARTAKDIRDAFYDYETIARLGCESCLNVPVIDEATPDGARVIGTVNMLHEAGYFKQAHIRAAQPYVELLVQPFRTWASASR